MRPVKFLPICFALSILGGCVFQNMNKGLSALQGQNISQAVAELGYPQGQETIMGNTVYTWGASQNVDMPVTTYNTTSGSINGVPYYGTTSNTNYVPENFNCSIQIAVDQNGDIVHTQWAGNLGGCMHYSNALAHNSN
jgi:hypothetical protein